MIGAGFARVVMVVVKKEKRKKILSLLNSYLLSAFNSNNESTDFINQQLSTEINSNHNSHTDNSQQSTVNICLTVMSSVNNIYYSKKLVLFKTT